MSEYVDYLLSYQIVLCCSVFLRAVYVCRVDIPCNLVISSLVNMYVLSNMVWVHPRLFLINIHSFEMKYGFVWSLFIIWSCTTWSWWTRTIDIWKLCPVPRHSMGCSLDYGNIIKGPYILCWICYYAIWYKRHYEYITHNVNQLYIGHYNFAIMVLETMCIHSFV